MYDDRFAWSGEIPLGFPGLNPVALQRITPDAGLIYSDSVTPTRKWSRVVGGANDGYVQGAWGYQMSLNSVNPATDKGGFKLPYFSGLWPSSGKLLMGLWTRQNYVMAHSPLMSSRGGTPLAYLATASSGRIRHMVYNSAGVAILDQFEDHPWVQTAGWQFVGQLLDMTAKTSQMFSVNQATKATWLGPVRSFTGAPNAACTADLDVYMLPTGNVWTTGVFDEALVAHPTGAFSLADFVDSMSRGLWADGQLNANRSNFTVSESGISPNGANREISTGAERLSWTARPVLVGAPAGVVPYWSSDNGVSWQTGAELPEPFSGLLRWTVPIAQGQSFKGFDVVEPVEPPPTLEPIADRSLDQGDIVHVALEFFTYSAPRWTVDTPAMASVTVTDGVMSIAAGFQTGSGLVTVTVSDDLNRSASQSFTVTVSPRQWDEPDTPDLAHSPIVLWGDSLPEAVLIDPLDAVVTHEVNGEQKFEFSISADHKYAGLIENERYISVAGEKYRVRTVDKSHAGGELNLRVFAEAQFYDLATASRVSAKDWKQVTAGEVMTTALAGTGWTVGVANVTTLRTYETEETNPLALLRTVQENHGGDLVFDNNAKKVSLVTQSGRTQGVGFFYGRGLNEARRISDTTALVTRLHVKNEDGLTIASVNDGKPYIDDFGFTSDVRVDTYEFKSGTAPFTMLEMAQVMLAKRARPEYSYELKVSDLSVQSGAQFDRFGVGDVVTVVDNELGISEAQRIVRLEYDVVSPWDSEITLSATLREAGSDDVNDSGTLNTGSSVPTFDLVPFNLLLNGRFDNALEHWAHFGAQHVEGGVTGDYAVALSGGGERWIEQTVQPDNRSAYALSFDLSSGGPAGWVPNVKAEAEVTYEDGSTEIIEIDLA